MIQSGLASQGFDPGPVDELFGPATRAAIEAWQRAQRHRATGWLTESEAIGLKALGEARHHERMSRTSGSGFRDCDHCPEMVIVPAGSFLMGSPPDEAERDEDEGPRRRVTIPSPFAVGKYEVTRWEFVRFVEATGRSMADPCWEYDDGAWDERSSRRPVDCVSWEDARAYVGWLSRETGRRYRLPSEAEWEFAARAGSTGPFHYGPTISTDQANYDGDFSYGSGRKGIFRDETVSRREFCSEWIRTARRAWECLGVGRGLLARAL